MEHQRQHRNPTKIIKVDKKSEFLNTNLRQFLSSQGIKLEHSANDSKQEHGNGIVGRSQFEQLAIY